MPAESKDLSCDWGWPWQSAGTGAGESDFKLNTVACNVFLLESFNGNTMKVMLKLVKCTNIVTAPHTPHRNELNC